MHALLRNPWIWTVAFVVIGGGIAGWWFWNRTPQLDGLIRQAFENAEQIVSYAQHVETQTMIDDRRIRVVGEYQHDEEKKRFSSLATTTLTLPEGGSHAFTLHTITIGEQMYTKVVSHSAALHLSVPASPEWKQFRADAIPPEYREIATPRPPLDNISLFRNAAKYLTLKEGRRDEAHNGETLARYTFNLTSQAFTEQSGPISMIAERVGIRGTVDVWVDESTSQIRVIRFSNDPYFSTTTLMFVNALPSITPPVP